MKGVKLILLWHGVCNTLSANFILRHYEKDIQIFGRRAARRSRQRRNHIRCLKIQQSAITNHQLPVTNHK